MASFPFHSFPFFFFSAGVQAHRSAIASSASASVPVL
jgi:hypothetical protein